VSVFSLSIHADYRCRHSGACCASDWDVPVEVPLYRSLSEAVGEGRARPVDVAAGGGPPLIVEDDLPDGVGAMLARTTAGDCVFYHRHCGLCVIHRDLGEPMLPSTCRHFPRVAVRDARGTFVSLTHYCPTAASLLFRDDVPLEIVEHPVAFPDRDYEGLVVSPDEWPPLLHPRMFTDVAGYDAWERHMVSRCADTSLTAESVIATLERDARLMRAAMPEDGASMAGTVTGLPPNGVFASMPDTLAESLSRHAQVMATVPDAWKPHQDEEGLAEVFHCHVRPHWHTWQTPLKRYLAARAFASWTAYQGRGLLTIVQGLDAALALVRVEAARQCRDAGRLLDGALMREAFRYADYSLNHLASADELATAWSHVEGR
jgi:Fe-S-cluster containining protein